MPARRAEIQRSTKSVREVAQEFEISEGTVRRWRARDRVTEGSHTRHRLRTTLSQAQGRLLLNSCAR